MEFYIFADYLAGPVISLALTITGPAFVVAYGLGLIINIALVRHFHDFRWQGTLARFVGAALWPFFNASGDSVYGSRLGSSSFNTSCTGHGTIGICAFVLSTLGKHGRLPTRLYGIFATPWLADPVSGLGK